MATLAEMRAEELVYEVADELGLTEDEVLGLDALAVADAALRRLRIDLKQQAGRPLTVHDYRPPATRSPIVVELEGYIEDSAEA